MLWFSNLQITLQHLIAVFQVGLNLFALVDAMTRRSDAYLAAGKLKKPLWLAILGGLFVVMIAFFPSPLSLPALAATIASIVYLGDVRRAIQQVTRGGSSNGPYG